MGLLATYGFADVPDDIPHESDGTPANITAALSWARRILAQRQGTTRLDTLIANRDRMLRQLENTTRTVNQALAAFDQQLDIATLENTDWRRVTLAAPNAAVGDDLRHAATTLRTTVAGLEADLRHDIKGILKTSTFIQLRRDIQQRREAAQELVRQIRATLQNVRTGVARVGVQVDWKVREDDNARQMVDLLTAPPSDEVFETMYDVLRRRMEEAGDEPGPTASPTASTTAPGTNGTSVLPTAASAPTSSNRSTPAPTPSRACPQASHAWPPCCRCSPPPGPCTPAPPTKAPAC